MIFKRCVQRVQTTFYPQTFLGNLIDTAVHRGNLSLCNFQISQLYQTRMQSILEYLITVEHLQNMHNGKLPFIRFEKMKKDNFMLSINYQCKAFSINLNTQHMNGKTPRIAFSTFIRQSRVVNSMRGNFSHPTYIQKPAILSLFCQNTEQNFQAKWCAKPGGVSLLSLTETQFGAFLAEQRRGWKKHHLPSTAIWHSRLLSDVGKCGKSICDSSKKW